MPDFRPLSTLYSVHSVFNVVNIIEAIPTVKVPVLAQIQAATETITWEKLRHLEIGEYRLLHSGNSFNTIKYRDLYGRKASTPGIRDCRNLYYGNSFNFEMRTPYNWKAATPKIGKSSQNLNTSKSSPNIPRSVSINDALNDCVCTSNRDK